MAEIPIKKAHETDPHVTACPKEITLTIPIVENNYNVQKTLNHGQLMRLLNDLIRAGFIAFRQDFQPPNWSEKDIKAIKKKLAIE